MSIHRKSSIADLRVISASTGLVPKGTARNRFQRLRLLRQCATERLVDADRADFLICPDKRGYAVVERRFEMLLDLSLSSSLSAAELDSKSHSGQIL
jgi:hypothetical protein